jgi:hypothetical protein
MDDIGECDMKPYLDNGCVVSGFFKNQTTFSELPVLHIQTP